MRRREVRCENKKMKQTKVSVSRMPWKPIKQRIKPAKREDVQVRATRRKEEVGMRKNNDRGMGRGRKTEKRCRPEGVKGLSQMKQRNSSENEGVQEKGRG